MELLPARSLLAVARSELMPTQSLAIGADKQLRGRLGTLGPAHLGDSMVKRTPESLLGINTTQASGKLRSDEDKIRMT